MEQIRDNIFLVTYAELGEPRDTGYYRAEGLGEVLIDAADKRYIEEHLKLGVEPAFFISKTDALQGGYVVVARREKA